MLDVLSAVGAVLTLSLALAAPRSPPDVPVLLPGGQLWSPLQPAARAQNLFAVDLYQELVSADNSLNRFYSPLSISTALALLYGAARGRTAYQMRNTLHYDTKQNLHQYGDHDHHQHGDHHHHQHGDHHQEHGHYDHQHGDYHQQHGDHHQQHEYLVKTDIPRRQAELVDYLNNRTQEGVVVSITNDLYVSNFYPVLSSYISYARKVFHSDVTTLDFSQSRESAELINERAYNNTNGKIQNAISADTLNALTVSVIVNAVYFKGDWLAPFERDATHAGQFSGLSSVTSVQMMYAYREFLVYRPPAIDRSFECLVLPYVGEEVAMVVVLPRKMHGIYEVEKQLSVELLETALSSARERSIVVYLPKFKLEESILLNDALEALGMRDVFAQTDSDLSGLTGNRGVYLDSAAHKAFVDVNEEGTEAAGVTVLTAVSYSRPMSFRADHPFLFAIMDKHTKAVLFLGRVADLPSADQYAE